MSDHESQWAAAAENTRAIFGDVISVYTRARAIEDGALVDVTTVAKEAGFVFPVAVTAAVWGTIQAIPESLRGIQGVDGRLWDVVWMARAAARANPSASQVMFTLWMDRNENGRRIKRLNLVMTIGPGDTWAPVVTILLPGED